MDQPPKPDELEVTVFGPGFGECILIHYGRNEWINVDSCVDPQIGRPAALDYLERLGIDPADCVRAILVTHWHDDHTKGIAEVVKACPNAIVACSGGLSKKEFLEIMQIFNRTSSEVGSGLSEIQDLIFTLKANSRRPKFVFADMPIYVSKNPDCKLTALSPVNDEYIRFLRKMSSFMPGPGQRETKYRFPNPSPNDLSVATLLEVGDIQVLLGADLEEHGGVDRGWSAVIASKTRPDAKASLVKVPHHGAASAHNPDMWTKMVGKDPCAVLSPWAWGGQLLPTIDDCNRILGFSREAYSTSRAARARRKNYPAAVAKTLREARMQVRPAEPPTGRVTFRCALEAEAPWTVDASDDARKLNRFYDEQ